MGNSKAYENRKENSSFECKENTGYSEMDILRKAYELILENSDLFFNELANAFTIEREKGESNLLI